MYETVVLVYEVGYFGYESISFGNLLSVFQ